jgi:GTPase SAR1 family protein
MLEEHGTHDFSVKLLVIGNSSVGKSSLIKRYAENDFSSKFFNTIGVDFVGC